jgi:LPS export ABC transporter protein LptC
MRIHDVYTKSINLVKRGAALVITLTLGAILLIPVFYSKNDRVDLAVHSSSEDSASSDDRMTSPRIIGKDNKNQLYSIIAEYGVKDGQNVIKMSKVMAKILLNDGRELGVTSDKGKSDTTTSIVDLETSVVVTLSSGEKMFTDFLQVDYKKSSAWTESGVRLFSGGNRLSAQKMFIISGGDEMRFLGNVKVRIEQ